VCEPQAVEILELPQRLLPLTSRDRQLLVLLQDLFGAIVQTQIQQFAADMIP
jgi:hypothetical protein